jgi:hypothetical protein
MPSSKEHKEKAERNHDTLQRLIASNGAPEWMAVVAFYTALHLVERLAACENLHHTKHPDRLAYLTRHKQHRVIHPHFQMIYDASLVARYGTVNQFAKAYPGSIVVDVLVNRHLADIAAHVDAHFNPPATPASSLPTAPKKTS